MTSRSEVHHANHYTIEASYKKWQIFNVEVYNVLLFCEVTIKMHVTYNEWISAIKTLDFESRPVCKENFSFRGIILKRNTYILKICPIFMNLLLFRQGLL